jgi:hypothetical protein
VEKIFHPDSYAYRPNKSALDAIGKARERCWRLSWVTFSSHLQYLLPSEYKPTMPPAVNRTRMH